MVDLLFRNEPSWVGMEHFKSKVVGQMKHNSLHASMRLYKWMFAVIFNIKRKNEHGDKKDGQGTTVLKVLFQMLQSVADENVLGSVAKH